MMLHSSEPALLQQNTTGDINIGTTISNTNNSGKRDAATSTVPNTKHMMPIVTAPNISQENQTLSGGRVFRSHTDSSKVVNPEEPRFQTAR